MATRSRRSSRSPSAAPCWPCASCVVCADCSRAAGGGGALCARAAPRDADRDEEAALRAGARARTPAAACHGGRYGSSNDAGHARAACTISRSSSSAARSRAGACRPRRVPPPTSTASGLRSTTSAERLHAEYVAGRDPLLAVIEEALEAVTAAPERTSRPSPCPRRYTELHAHAVALSGSSRPGG